jgi:5-methylcytosine-specific restriction protein A
VLRCPTVCAEPGCRRTNQRGSRWCDKHQTDNTFLRQQRAADQQRRRDLPWKAWYDLALWRGPNGLRITVLARDPVCKVCNRNPSTIADHIRPHRGNFDLFCSLDNLQGICEACHNEKSARELNTLGANQKAEITWEGPRQFKSI